MMRFEVKSKNSIDKKISRMLRKFKQMMKQKDQGNKGNEQYYEEVICYEWIRQKNMKTK